VFGEGIATIKGLLALGLAGVTMRGWVSKEELATAWARTETWLYPCTFAETFCLTALEAAASGTLIVCPDLAALQNTVGDRGLVVPGDAATAEWQQKALTSLFGLAPEEKARLIETNRVWASLLTWKGQANRFLEQYLKPALVVDAADMYNWTHDIPHGTRVLFEQMLRRHTGAGVRLLEIGTYAGTSLVEMLRILPEATAIAIDRWTNYDENGLASLGALEERCIERVFHENLRRAGVSGRVQTLKGDSVAMLLDLVEQKEQFDFVYVDGSHKCIDCYTDMALSWRLLKTGGTMVVDDYLLQPKIVAEQQSTAGAVLDYPMKGVDHFLSKYEGTYRVLDKGYRVCLEKS
jgi:predicted O-methyltransferase YrrM